MLQQSPFLFGNFVTGEGKKAEVVETTGNIRRDRRKETRVGSDEAFPWRRQSSDRPWQRSAEEGLLQVH